MADTVIVNSLAHVQHIAALDEAAGVMFNNLDLTPLLVYSVATVPAAVLLTLAEQFDVMGPGGWELATTEEAQRELIRGAIELHRRKGTVWSVKEAIRRVGYSDVKITEHVSLDGFFYDGTYLLDGSQQGGGGFWADFWVKVGVPEGASLSGTDRAKIVAMVNEYKNARSRLVGITFVLLFSDTLEANDDDLQVGQDPLSEPDFLFSGLYYNGAALLDGSHTGNKAADPMELKIFQNGVLISTETL